MSRRRNTPLLWATPPGSLLRQLYLEARRSVPHHGNGGANSDPAINKQSYLRKVAKVYARKLIAAGIYVEGLS